MSRSLSRKYSLDTRSHNPHVRLTIQPHITMLANVRTGDRVMSYRIGGNQVCMDCPVVPMLRLKARCSAHLLYDRRAGKTRLYLTTRKRTGFAGRLQRRDSKGWRHPTIGLGPNRNGPKVSQVAACYTSDARMEVPSSSGKGGALSSSR